jgi:site-specific DNA-methyltransferase (adenine-specific)
MKMIDDHSIDMILCDLPYQVTDNKWDIMIPIEKLWEQYNRIIKDNGAVVFTAIQPFTSIIVMSNIKNFKYEMIWQKDNGTNFFNVNIQPFKIHESVLVFYKKLPVYNPQKTKNDPYVKHRIGDKLTTNYEANAEHHRSTYNNGDRHPLSVIKFSRDFNKLHPTQKPLKLFEYLIKTYTHEGQIVLDPCMGSGTTAEACQNLRRQYIGFEIDSEYYKIIQNRIHSNCRKLTEWDDKGVSSEIELNQWAVSDMM